MTKENKENKENVTIERFNFFPQVFFEFKFSTELITPLYNEVLEKKDEIKRISDMVVGDGVSDVPTVNTVDYWTDYSQPVKLNEWEKLIPHISNSFNYFNCTCSFRWTAIYGKHGMHNLHRHSDSLFRPQVNNFSCVLYLTNVGATTFFNPTTHNAADLYIDVKAELGKMIMFPSHIIHTSSPHNLNKEKIIISANWQITSNI